MYRRYVQSGQRMAAAASRRRAAGGRTFLRRTAVRRPSLSFNLLGWGSGSLLILYGRARRVAVREYGLRMIMCSRQRTMITSEGRAHAQGTARTRRLNDKLRPSESRGRDAVIDFRDLAGCCAVGR